MYCAECRILSGPCSGPWLWPLGPFCVIYGFGALGACMLLRPVSGSPMELYTASMAMGHYHGTGHSQYYGTVFGSFWWDYSHKPFNYKGMVCLESSLAWGLLGLFFFYFLDIRVRAAVISLPGHVGTVLAVGLTMFYLVDFIHCFRLRMGGMEEEDEPAVGRLKIY